MESLTHLGTFDDLVAPVSDEVKALATHTRALIAQLHPDVIEVPRKGEKTAAYGYGQKKMSEAYAFITVNKAHINLGFYHADNLDDAHNLLEGTGKSIRHIKIRHMDDLHSPAIEGLLKQAMQERKTALKLDA